MRASQRNLRNEARRACKAEVSKVCRSILIGRAANYQRATQGQTKSRRCGSHLKRLRSRNGGAIETINVLIGFHHSDFIARNDLNILGIVREQVYLALALVAIELLRPQDCPLLIQLRRERIVAGPLRVEGCGDQQHQREKDQAADEAVGLVPNFGIPASSGAELLHGPSLIRGFA